MMNCIKYCFEENGIMVLKGYFKWCSSLEIIPHLKANFAPKGNRYSLNLKAALVKCHAMPPEGAVVQGFTLTSALHYRHNYNWAISGNYQLPTQERDFSNEGRICKTLPSVCAGGLFLE